MEMRDVSTKIPLSEVPFVMRAMGFYPSEQEVLLFFVHIYGCTKIQSSPDISK